VKGLLAFAAKPLVLSGIPGVPIVHA
jgi:hypothetical protein